MGYLVLARKWRPQTFDDMTGQEHVVRTVANAIKLDRVAHAYLFCGPRGVGKTTAARLLAKALNCVKGPTATPCGVCQPCLEIAAGTSVDVAEIDGASNNGVENVRELRENAKYLPQRDRHRIYIIDEVHMLSGAAFNALLKTLEEPPGHVKFIFATTEPHKLPDTILSRCQRHDFRRIPVERMLARLKQIAAEEKAGLSDASLALIVRQADGGMRDALSLLDQVMSACGPGASDADVAEALGAIDRTVVQTLATALIRRDARVLLESVEEVFVRGADLKRLAEEVALELRHVLVTRATGRPPAELAESEQRVVVELAQQADPAQLARLFDVLHGAVWDVGRAAQPRLALEMALLKAVQLAPTASIPELLGRVEQLLGPPPRGGPTAPPTRGAPVVAPAARSARTVAADPTPPASTPGPRDTRSAASPPPGELPKGTPGPAPSAARAAGRAPSAPPAAPEPPAPPAATTGPVSATSAATSTDSPRAAGAPASTPLRPTSASAVPLEVSVPAAERALPLDTSPGGCATGECLPEVAPARAGRDDPSRPLLERWRAALDTVARESSRHAASLKQGRVLHLREGEVGLAFRPDAGFHRTTVTGQSGRQVVERLLSLHFGRPTRLLVDDRAAPGGEKSLAELDAEERAEHERATGQSVRSHPAIVATLRILGGELEHIQVLERERVGAPGSDVVDEQP
jgi:DNA polymerase III subunit gamma/tau